jgi:hypothetical protein
VAVARTREVKKKAESMLNPREWHCDSRKGLKGAVRLPVADFSPSNHFCCSGTASNKRIVCGEFGFCPNANRVIGMLLSEFGDAVAMNAAENATAAST